MAEFGTVGRSSIDSLLNWSSPPPQEGPSEVQVGTAPPGSIDGGTTVLSAGSANGDTSPASPQDGGTSGDPVSLVEAGSVADQTTQSGTIDDQAIPPDQAGPAVDQVPPDQAGPAVDQIPPDQAGPADGQGDPTVAEVQSDQLSVGPETVDDVIDGEPGSVDPQAAEGDPAWEPSDADESANPDGTGTSDDATEDPNAPQDQDDTGNQDDTNDQNGTDTGDQGDQGDTSDPQTDPGTGQEDPSGSQGQDPADSQTDPGSQTDPSVPDGQDGTTVPETPSTDPSAGSGGTEDPGSGTPETPTTETPTPDLPTADTPTAETPAADTPTAETPAADMPSADMPSADMPSAGTPSAETPSSTGGGGGGGGGGGDDQGKGKGDDKTDSKDTPKTARDAKLAADGVDGGWRKIRPEVMEKLGKAIGPSKDGKGDTPGDHMGAAEDTARNIDIGFPGFGLLGAVTFAPAYHSARSTAADYLKSAKHQLGAWDEQLQTGAGFIRDADNKSTV
ncbi:hypothetical protein [Nonomuraea sp. NEAU-A123]|uniref:hypothetical protein n=1 Tax=Nonomuraea sp. NEAU-A123 TaxID=2839649 RepID=UPI001BE43240|nr:hypothetical protein [Nonomuraea sp. NEAU-A123]MBT2224517.1 hypothetical protein [Nonomuraea sp. NEAU-A123]